MRMSVSIHPPSRGDSLEWRVRLNYRDGASRLSMLPFSDYSEVQDAAQAFLDDRDVVQVVIEGRPAVEFRSTKGHDVDGWRVDARYSLDDDDDDVESSGPAFSVVLAPTAVDYVERRGYWVATNGNVYSGWFSLSIIASNGVLRRRVNGRNRWLFSDLSSGWFAADSSARAGVVTAWGMAS